MRLPLLFLILATSVLSSSAQDLSRYGVDTTQTVPTGLPVNMYAPLFMGVDADGNEVGLQDRLKQSTVVLVFVQGSWSRHCTKFLRKLQDSLDVLGQQGAQVIAVSPEKQEFLGDYRNKSKVTFPVISDQGNVISSNYDVNFHVTKSMKSRHNFFRGAKLDKRNANTGDVLPVAAVYVLAPSARVAYRYFNYDRRQRPYVSEILEAVKGLANERR